MDQPPPQIALGVPMEAGRQIVPRSAARARILTIALAVVCDFGVERLGFQDDQRQQVSQAFQRSGIGHLGQFSCDVADVADELCRVGRHEDEHPLVPSALHGDPGD